MKARVKDEIKAKGLTNFGPNRRQGKTCTLCTCGQVKRAHYKEALGHSYRGGDEKNCVAQTPKKA
jgi:hypothetical protein